MESQTAFIRIDSGSRFRYHHGVVRESHFFMPFTISHMNLDIDKRGLSLPSFSQRRNQRRANWKRDGFFFTYQITPTHFGLNFMRVVPLARVRLDQIQYIRTRSGERLAGLLSELLAHPFKCRYWPHPMMKTAPWQSTPFVVRLYSGRRIFIRLRAGFHYQLRAAVGEARLAAGKTPMPASPAASGPID